ncbi:MAG: peptidoglycan DD-metalloendopeptidase family protein [Minisyncoccia bacterium]
MLLVSIFFSNPYPAHAGLFSFINKVFSGINTEAVAYDSVSQDLSSSSSIISSPSSDSSSVLDSCNFVNSDAQRTAAINIVGGDSLISENGPVGTFANVNNSQNFGQISLYVVRQNDTLSSIGQMFGVSANTIVWANNLTSKTLKLGQQLVILPVSGITHTVTKGETLKSITKKYGGDIDEIIQFNDLDRNDPLAIGQKIIIPDGEGSVVSTPSKSSSSAGASKLIAGYGGPDCGSYFMRPLIGGRRTQSLHGYNAIDIATPVGTPVLASASGQVIIAKMGGWNGGYGSYIVISHDNGAQTVYGHLSYVNVSVGETVAQGQAIGSSGNTGKSTGPHLHFEIRGAKNPF